LSLSSSIPLSQISWAIIDELRKIKIINEKKPLPFRGCGMNALHCRVTLLFAVIHYC
jgi:hypothetical protein